MNRLVLCLFAISLFYASASALAASDPGSESRKRKNAGLKRSSLSVFSSACSSTGDVQPETRKIKKVQFVESKQSPTQRQPISPDRAVGLIEETLRELKFLQDDTYDNDSDVDNPSRENSTTSKEIRSSKAYRHARNLVRQTQYLPRTAEYVSHWRQIFEFVDYLLVEFPKLEELVFGLPGLLTLAGEVVYEAENGDDEDQDEDDLSEEDESEDGEFVSIAGPQESDETMLLCAQTLVAMPSSSLENTTHAD